MRTRKTPQQDKGIDGIATLEEVKIGGIPQWIMMRGINRHHPILLFLHGGPGTAQIGFIRPFQTKLEEHFVVVNWDQRGAGLSYSKHIPQDSMAIRQFVADTIELVHWLLQRLGQRKIYLAGHSWGSLLGMLAIQQCPDLFYMYYGVSQLVNVTESDQISYEYTLRRAKETKKKRAVRQLEKIGEPPWDRLGHEAIQQKWLSAFHGGFFYKKNPLGKMALNLVFEPEYRLTDIVKLAKGRFFSSHHLQDEMETVDLRVQVPEVKVPVVFCMGRHDYITPAELAESYLTILKAPQKKWIWFEQSAHSPIFEEPEKFAYLLIETACYH